MMTSEVENPQLLQPHLSVKELATRLGVPQQTVYVWRTKGYGPRGMTIGRHVRFRIEDVESWEQSLVEADGQAIA